MHQRGIDPFLTFLGDLARVKAGGQPKTHLEWDVPGQFATRAGICVSRANVWSKSQQRRYACGNPHPIGR